MESDKTIKMKNEIKQVVDDYILKDWENKDVRLSSLFGSNKDLILIHNMGRQCSYCTMWADGFNGVLDHMYRFSRKLRTVKY